MPATSPEPTASPTRARPRGQFDCTVLVNQFICREHYRLVLRVPPRAGGGAGGGGFTAFPPTEPGQFVQVACREPSRDYAPDHEQDWSPGQPFDVTGRELTGPLAFLRRPFSLAGRTDAPDGATDLELIHRVVGVGTDWLSRLAPGDAVQVLGPLGNRFALPADDGIALLVGGGVGIPPMLYLAERLAGRRAVAFCGALTRDLLPLTLTADAAPPSSPDAIDPLPNVAEFARHGLPAVITTDDGSYGYRGYVTQALEAWLDREGFGGEGSGVSEGSGVRVQGSGRARSAPDAVSSSSSLNPEPRPLNPPITIYTCGPEPMMKRVADIAIRRGLDCQIAVERAMACGMGTCQSCCIKVRKPDPSEPPLAGSDWCWRLACTDGPVFHARDLLW